MNEGCATFVHFYIVNALYNKGLIPEGAMLEILHSHSNVLAQPDYNDQRYSGINPYAFGFAMMDDIRRICVDPTEEDREWFPEIAGSEDWRSVLKDAWANYRDESFIQQFLSPTIIRKFRLFTLADESKDNFYSVSAIHNKRGYRQVRDALARSHDVAILDPDIQVVNVDLLGDRQLRLKYTARNGIPLEEKYRDMVLVHMKKLWEYDVVIET